MMFREAEAVAIVTSSKRLDKSTWICSVTLFKSAGPLLCSCQRGNEFNPSRAGLFSANFPSSICFYSLSILCVRPPGSKDSVEILMDLCPNRRRILVNTRHVVPSAAPLTRRYSSELSAPTRPIQHAEPGVGREDHQVFFTSKKVVFKELWR